MVIPREFQIKTCILLSVALLITIEVESSRPSGNVHRGLVGETIFDVTKYGAKPDGLFDSTQAFMLAWNAACKSVGPGKLVIPPGDFVVGEVIFQGPCTVAKPFTIEIQGNVLALTDVSAYTTPVWIKITALEDVIITGGGTINGRGQAVWQYAGKGNDAGAQLPDSLVIQKVRNAQMHHLNFVDAMGFHSKVTDCTDITVSNLNITAPADSPNTDGMHISSSTNVNLTDSVIATGDDCVSIGHTTVNILVAGITCGPGHGISVGSLGKRPDETDVKGITIVNCTLTGTTNGARIKTYHASPAFLASGIVYKDIVMNGVKNPILIDQHYDSKKKPEPSKVKISDVHFINIKGTTTSKIPISLACSEAVPCEGIELADVDLAPCGAIGPLESACTNAQIIMRGNPLPPGTCK